MSTLRNTARSKHKPFYFVIDSFAGTCFFFNSNFLANHFSQSVYVFCSSRNFFNSAISLAGTSVFKLGNVIGTLSVWNDSESVIFCFNRLVDLLFSFRFLFSESGKESTTIDWSFLTDRSEVLTCTYSSALNSKGFIFGAPRYRPRTKYIALSFSELDKIWQMHHATYWHEGTNCRSIH